MGIRRMGSRGGKINNKGSENMKKEKTELESSSQIILPKDEQIINDTLIYDKWRDDGKLDHKKRDIEKKIKKANAVRKAKKGLNINGN